MYEFLYKQILEAESKAEEGRPAGQGVTKQNKSEKMCWNKGYWLSFMANIVEQVAYLGVLRLIW